MGNDYVFGSTVIIAIHEGGDDITGDGSGDDESNNEDKRGGHVGMRDGFWELRVMTGGAPYRGDGMRERVNRSDGRANTRRHTKGGCSVGGAKVGGG